MLIDLDKYPDIKAMFYATRSETGIRGETYHDLKKPCKRCGGTERYQSNKRCLQCRVIYTRKCSSKGKGGNDE